LGVASHRIGDESLILIANPTLPLFDFLDPPLTHRDFPHRAKYNGSCGKLLPNVEAKIVDLEGKELAAGQEGELWVRGPNVFPGYLNRPELQADTFSACGFFKTGDIAYADPKGNYYITDRLKELIKYSESWPPINSSKPDCRIRVQVMEMLIFFIFSLFCLSEGFQVAPAELEALLQGHPDIADACVIPAHDKQRETEVPRAYLVLKPSSSEGPSDAKAKEIIEWVAARVTNHKQLRGGVRFVDSVPKNASGKLLRRVLKEEARKEDRAEQGAKL
jgi:4-coumarate--CoA ligase